MTKLLSQIQLAKHSNSDLKAPTPPKMTSEQTKELKVLCALATVLVMEHEKVAVVAKQDIMRSVEVFTSTDSIVANKFTQKSTQTASIMEYIRNFIVAINPREKTRENYPTILNAKDSFKGTTLNELKADGKNRW
jgi:hypothetical protein